MFFSRSQKEGEPVLLEIRNEDSKTAVVFVHGFSGHLKATWGRFPELVAADSRLDGWDVLSVGYTTNLRLDVPGLWRASPDLPRLAKLLLTVAAHDERLRDREVLSFIGHSMGGLVIQRALLDSSELTRRVGHVTLFGTPSAGLVKAGLGRFLKRQFRDMAADGPFITHLRRDWRSRFGSAPPFRFLAIAGEEDEFVGAGSVWADFPEDQQRAVYGNHLEIVKPESKDSLSVQVVTDVLSGGGGAAGPWNGARIALERADFQRAADLLWPHRDELDDPHAVTLALALEGLGRSEEALAVLEAHTPTGTDVKGVLAGRLKRRWLGSGRREDGERAEALYREGLTLAEMKDQPAQAFYHAINVAFLRLARNGDRAAARNYAEKALTYCGRSGGTLDHWNLATQGEAYLILGDAERALVRYRQALAKNPPPRAIESMYAQAIRVADLLSETEMISRLEITFRPRVVSEAPPPLQHRPSSEEPSHR